jgi:predicted RNA polymerase sigma factor
MAFGPDEGLALLDGLAGALDGHHRLHAVRGDLLARAGRVDEARVELALAAEGTSNATERELLVARIGELMPASRRAGDTARSWVPAAGSSS